ncbi:MAG: DegT/DnrJ/EryC1/StrS family aminotransferase [Brockia lithotrophica]|nr:DegT/DnrJ/EryC1/StrS family aminotransferase [Brockia lithotrophica]
MIPDVQEGYVFHQYTIRVLGGKRDAVRRFLADRGIATMVYYPVPLHRLPVYATPPGEFPEAERAASEVLSLPIWPKLPPATLHEVAETSTGGSTSSETPRTACSLPRMRTR